MELLLPVGKVIWHSQAGFSSLVFMHGANAALNFVALSSFIHGSCVTQEFFCERKRSSTTKTIGIIHIIDIKIKLGEAMETAWKSDFASGTWVCLDGFHMPI